MDRNKRIFITGATGLVGSYLFEYFSSKTETIPLSRKTGFDILNPDSMNVLFHDRDQDVVIHAAGKADVDACELDKEEDIKILRYKDIKKREKGGEETAWTLNVIGTQNVIDACKKGNKKFIYISTDFVFDGEKSVGESYSEEDEPNPINWYAQTKYEGEKLVASAEIPYLITRIAFPYRKEFSEKKDFVRAILAKLKNEESISAIEDQVITPTLIDDIALGLENLISNNSTGIFHVVGSQPLTPYQAAVSIADIFNGKKELISKINREQFFANRAKRPFNLSLKNDKIRSLGVEMKRFEEGLEEIRRQSNF